MSTKTATKKPATAPTEQASAEQPRPQTRKDLLAALTASGYTGPTSFTAATLRGVAAWLEVGAPKDGDVPSGVLYAVHPDLRPSTQPRQPRLTAFQRGFREAVAAVDGIGDDLQAIRRWIAANTAEEVGA